MAERRWRNALWVVGILFILLLSGYGVLRGHAFWKWWSLERPSPNGGALTHPHADLVVPLATLAGAAVLAWAALRQAVVASKRHDAQTNADRQRRITESFSKAIDQLASDKLEVRLGGIYSLERISKESADDYWTVMENLTAFVRERTRRTEAEWSWQQRLEQSSVYLESEGQRAEKPAADIAAVLTVIKRRSNQNRERELGLLDFSGAVLRGADLWEAPLKGAVLREAHLEDADLWKVRLEGADLREAHLEDAELIRAHLEGASLIRAHLEDAILGEVHLEGADLTGAHLEYAYLIEAHLEGAKLFEAEGLTETQFAKAFWNESTTFPAELAARLPARRSPPAA